MDELEMVTDFLNGGPAVTSRARAAARAALVARIEQETSRKGRRSIWRRVLPLGVAAPMVALVLALVAVPLLRGGQGVSAAARVLQAASHIAAAQRAQPLAPGEYAYTKSEGAYFDEISRSNGGWGALVRTTREIWVAADGSGRIVQHSDPPTFLVPADRARWQVPGAPLLTRLSTGETYDQHYAAGNLPPPLEVDGLHPNQLLRLQNDPIGLAAAIRSIAERSSNPLSWEMLVIVGDILGESAALPQFRASLYQVASTIPDIELVGTVRDRAGRKGIAVAASRQDQRYELIFDPGTSKLLAQETTLRHRIPDTNAPPGTAIAYTLYLASGITRSLNTGA